jgi:hypothetical protein
MRRALSKVPKPQDDLYKALTRSWDEALKLAEEKDEMLDRFFPAEQLAESQWSATNPYSPNPEQDAQALAAVLREWLIRDVNVYGRWAESEALEFARLALTFYQEEFAADLVEPDGLLSQAFMVKGINEIRALTLQALPLLRQIAAKEGDHHSEVMHALGEGLDRNFQRVFHEFAELKTALTNPYVAPVKERWIGLPNTHDQILSRTPQAQALLDALSTEGPAIVSITAPPGFGKSAVFTLALRFLFAGGEPPQDKLTGIAVLDAKAEVPGVVTFARLLARITGWQDAAAKFASLADGQMDSRLRRLFFDFLRQSRSVWLIVENAEAVLAPAASTNLSRDFRDLLSEWCNYDHHAKLLLLTRHAVYPEPKGHRRLSAVEEVLIGGLPLDDAIRVLRQRLKDTRFCTAAETLLGQIAQKLHRVPMALEQFAAYLSKQAEGIELDQRFVEQNDLLRLDPSEQLPRVIRENLNLLDTTSLFVLRVVAWAAMPVPSSGLLALHSDASALLTRLVRSNQLSASEGT